MHLEHINNDSAMLQSISLAPGSLQIL